MVLSGESFNLDTHRNIKNTALNNLKNSIETRLKDSPLLECDALLTSSFYSDTNLENGKIINLRNRILNKYVWTLFKQF